MKKVCIFLLLLAVSIPLVPCDEEDLGLPFYESDAEIVRHTGFVLKYSEEHEQAEWVAYLLTLSEVEAEDFQRTDNFRVDPQISTGSATLDGYRGSGYDRGHFAPAGDFRWSSSAMSDTFFLSNMSPQSPSFNRGVWKKLENRVRTWALENDEIYVVTGPVLADGPFETIGPNEVAVPKRYYKVILDYKEPEIKAIAFILPNKRSTEALSSFAVTIDEVERITGLDFFHLLPDDIEELLESSLNRVLWPDLD